MNIIHIQVEVLAQVDKLRLQSLAGQLQRTVKYSVEHEIGADTCKVTATSK